MYGRENIDFSVLVGKTLTKIENIDNEELIFHCDDDTTYKLYHDQNCCEHVRVEDIIGDLNDLVGDKILVAEERVSDPDETTPKLPEWSESATWTFYTLRTVNASVDIRWLGESNGYYSESVDFCKI